MLIKNANLHEVSHLYMDHGDIPLLASRVGAKDTGCGGRGLWLKASIFIVKNGF